jgi:hypothetical protein
LQVSEEQISSTVSEFNELWKTLNKILSSAKKKSNWLLKAKVFETSLVKCRQEYNRVYNGTKSRGRSATVKGLDNGITDNLICANNLKKPADTCQGLLKIWFHSSNFYSQIVFR